MAANPSNLTIELRSVDGTSTEYYQADKERIRKTMQLLSSARLPIQPQLVLASEHGVNVFPIRGIDIILARVLAQAPPFLPLIFPAGLRDISEVGEEAADVNSKEEYSNDDSQPAKPLVTRVEVCTVGGWKMALQIAPITGTTLHDQRQWFMHFMNQPVVSFRLRDGGIGLINTNNITRVSASPTPDGLPNIALPVELRGQTPPQNQMPMQTRIDGKAIQRTWPSPLND